MFNWLKKKPLTAKLVKRSKQLEVINMLNQKALNGFDFNKTIYLNKIGNTVFSINMENNTLKEYFENVYTIIKEEKFLTAFDNSKRVELKRLFSRKGEICIDLNDEIEWLTLYFVYIIEYYNNNRITSRYSNRLRPYITFIDEVVKTLS